METEKKTIQKYRADYLDIQIYNIFGKIQREEKHTISSSPCPYPQ
jgi:hypothetical protein